MSAIALVSTVIIAVGVDMPQTVEIHIRLLDEGTECSRPTQALDLGHGLLKVLPTSNYDPKDEVAIGAAVEAISGGSSTH